MSLIGERFPSSEELCGVLGNCNHEFWVSSIAGATPREFPECVQSVILEEHSALETFTHCYFIESEDIRGTSDFLFKQAGTGLRKTSSVRPKAVPGVVYLLFNNSGPSPVSSRRYRDGTDEFKLSVAMSPLHSDISKD